MQTYLNPEHLEQQDLVKTFFLSVFSRIWAEYGYLLRKSPYSVQMW